MEASYCGDCKRNTEIVFDHSSGDTVCSECGLVLEARFIDETSEWRTFADDSGDHDPNRVGERTDPLLDNGKLWTMIKNPDGKPNNALNKSMNFVSDPETNRTNALQGAFKSLGDMASKLGLVGSITDRAKQTFKTVDDQRSGYKIKNRDATLAACLYLACKQEDKPRTLKEIKTVANGVTVKEIGRASKCIQEKLPATEAVAQHSTSLMMSRFVSNLGLSYLAVKAAQEAVKKIEEFDIRRAPTSIAAAVIFMVNDLCEDKKPIQDIAAVTQVAPNTIRESYKEIFPYRDRIVPAWFTEKAKAV